MGGGGNHEFSSVAFPPLVSSRLPSFSSIRQMIPSEIIILLFINVSFHVCVCSFLWVGYGGNLLPCFLPGRLRSKRQMHSGTLEIENKKQRYTYKELWHAPSSREFKGQSQVTADRKRVGGHRYLVPPSLQLLLK